MRTDFSPELLATDKGARANEILRACVHCGFCNATCPTYQLTGDELDGPRGRIYLIRELLETGTNSERATYHLDRCLTCRACETTCPSGVQYGELAEIARNELGPRRSGMTGWLRRGLRWMIPPAARLRRMARLGRYFRWLLPGYLREQIPARVGRPAGAAEAQQDAPNVLVLNGCAQQVSTAGTNEHLVQLLVRHGINVTVATEETCCGSLDLHLGDEAAALRRIRQNIDALTPHLGEVSAILSSASGCGVTVKDYARLLAQDPAYAEQAAQIAACTVDVSEYLAAQQLPLQARRGAGTRVAWHAPCSLQHGQQVNGVVEALLERAGYALTEVKDKHLCCGSAGTYSVLQPQMSAPLRAAKIKALQAAEPACIATANVGCQVHLQQAAEVEVVHWIELLE
ncbi:MAG: glycolate oxidase subunit GlcF [Pseudomonadota bacterium]